MLPVLFALTACRPDGDAATCVRGDDTLYGQECHDAVSETDSGGSECAGPTDADADGWWAAEDGGADCDDHDAGVGDCHDSGDGDTGEACVPTGVESCNGLDDDCDGLIDDAFALSIDTPAKVAVLGRFLADGTLGLALGVTGSDGDGAVDIYDATGAWIVRIEGTGQSPSFGSQLATGRDLTGDGVFDLVIAAPNAETADGPNSGRVFVLPGPIGPATSLDDAIGWFEGGELDGQPGAQIALLPDFTGDGLAELAIGYYRYTLLFSGAPAASARLADAVARFEVNTGGGPWHYATVPDADGDGRREFVMGMETFSGGEGAVFTAHSGSLDAPLDTLSSPDWPGLGSKLVTVADQLWSLSGTTPLRLPEFTALPLAAANLANGGDLDHDGAEDLLLVTEDAIVAIAADLSTIGQSRPAATLQSARDDGPAFDVDGDGLPDLLGLYDGVPAVLSGASAFFAPCDADGDGISAAAGDCDDGDSSVHPLARDRCNGVDDDCDGVVDGPVDLALPRVGEQAPAAILLLDDGSAYDEPGDGLILDRDGVASGFGALDGIFVDGVLGRGPGTDQPAALLYAPTAADNLVAHGDSADFILPVGLSGDASTLATLTLRDGTGWTRTGQIAALGDIDGDGAGDAAFGLVDPIGHAGIAVLPVTASGTLSADDAEIFVQLPAGWTSWTLGTDDAGRGGDLDGDGRADLLLGSPAAYYGQGRVSVVVSPASGVLVVDDDALLHLYGEPGDGLGAAIALGDLDGDGTDDAALADQRGARLLHGAGCPVLGERRASENAWLAIVDADHSGLPELWSAGATGELLRDGEPFRQVLTLFGTADGALVYGDAEGEAVLRASCAPTP